jgi:serine/threonine protein kinase/Flp pilus assembly protein TadD
MIDPLRERLRVELGREFTIESELPRGGMSHVFVAEEIALGRRVVIKVLDPDLAAGMSAERFKREVTLTARLQHPHIVPIYAAGEVNGLPYYTMPFVLGDSLRSRLERDGALPVTQTMGILRDVALALECAHEHNIVHRDIKPDNILLSGRSAIVTDFGVAKAFTISSKPGTTLTSFGMTLGTPAYMAPEQGAADPTVDHRADLYALGVVAYEMLTGKTPFAGRPAMAMIAAHVTEEPVPIDAVRTGLPPALSQLVMQLLVKDPGGRPQSAGELLAALSSIGSKIDEQGQLLTDASEIRSVAVLPFRNLSHEQDGEYLSDGITEEILNALARLPSLRVAARSSSFAFKNMDVDVKDIARKLRVGNVLEGSVRQVGNHIRVTAQLSNAADGFQKWSERYDREIADVFEIQEDIASKIAASLQVALFAKGGRISSSVRRSSLDIEAYELYLKGRHYLDRRLDGMERAMDFYQRALERDPKFALAHTGVAEVHFLLTMYDAVVPRVGVPKSRMAALRALALDPNLAEALIVLSNASLWYDWNHAETLRLIERAMQLKRSDPLVHSAHAFYFASLGRHDEAIERATYASELDPLGVLASGNRAIISYLASRFEDAVAYCESTLDNDSNDSEAYRWRALSLFQLGRRDEAFQSIASSVDQSQRAYWPLANQAAMFARANNEPDALEILAELEKRAVSEAVPPLAIASVHYGLGNLDAFFAALDESIAARDLWLIQLNVDPGFAAVRGEPRFKAAVARIIPEQ